jgi:LysM domain
VIAVATAAAILRPALLPEAPMTGSPPAGLPAQPPGLSASPQRPAPATTAPRLDVVRITPQGDAVIAGRAAPGTEVTVQEGNHVIGRARAGADGTWVVTPASPLPSGAGALTVAGPDGKTGPESVLVSIPAHPGPAPLAVLTAPSQPPTVLQAPAGKLGNRLALQALEYGRSGQVQFSGRAPPGARVRLYVDNKAIGQAVSGSDGGWSLSAASAVLPGIHRLRIDQRGASGRMAARIDLPFTRDVVPETGLASGNVIVQPGQSLWRIARGAYGQGIRYTVIYAANLGEIRDPNRIYPGQVFAVPPER